MIIKTAKTAIYGEMGKVKMIKYLKSRNKHKCLTTVKFSGIIILI